MAPTFIPNATRKKRFGDCCEYVARFGRRQKGSFRSARSSLTYLRKKEERETNLRNHNDDGQRKTTIHSRRPKAKIEEHTFLGPVTENNTRIRVDIPNASTGHCKMAGRTNVCQKASELYGLVSR